MTGHGPIGAITPRQHQVLQLIAAGHTDREIAEQLGMGLRTVYSHTEHIRWALGARNRAHAVTIGHQAGLLRYHQAAPG